MRTVTIHVSDETAAHLALHREGHAKGIRIVKARLELLQAEYDAGCTDPDCEALHQIEVLKRSIDGMECVLRFYHDVLSSLQFAPVQE